MKKSVLYGVFAVVGAGLIGFIAWGTSSGKSGANTPYAGVSGNDLPTVVGPSSLGGPKIPFNATANYMEYTPEMLASALKSGNATLLYFYADWCGTCRAQEPVNQTFFQQALGQNLPLTGIRVNVDYNQTLMRQYGINYQHSYVLLDKSGSVVDKFFGDHTVDELKQKVAQAL